MCIYSIRNSARNEMRKERTGSTRTREARGSSFLVREMIHHAGRNARTTYFCRAHRALAAVLTRKLSPLPLLILAHLSFFLPCANCFSLRFLSPPLREGKTAVLFFTFFILCPLCSALSACLGEDARECASYIGIIHANWFLARDASHFSLVR